MKRSGSDREDEDTRRIKPNTKPERIVFKRGCILTCVPGCSGEPALEEYEWMEVADGCIKQVGAGNPPKDCEEGAEIFDLKGRVVLPGLFDSHCHVFFQGKMQQVLVLEGARSIEELQAKLREYHAAHPDVQVIEGTQWDQELLGRFPTKEDLDVINIPIVITRRCWHICCINTAAMKLCGIRGDEVIEGGAVDVGSDGMATGILREGAMDALLKPLKAAMSEDQQRRHLATGMQVFLRNGCTSVLTNDSMEIGGISDPWDRYRELGVAGELPIRIFLTIAWKELEKEQKPLPSIDQRFTMFRVKLWTDGALGASTAALEDPYSDDPKCSNKGILQIEPAIMRHAISLAMANGFGVEAHTIGDRSLRELLDAFDAEKVSKKQRFTLTHCQITSPVLNERMAKLGTIASIQPQFANSDAGIAPKRLGVGSDRLRNSYAWSTMRRAGVRLAGGSDAPVEEPDPLTGMYRAMINDIHPSENLSFAEALEMYTLGGAYAAFREHDLGALKPGFRADFVVTSLRGGRAAVEQPELFRAARVDEVWVDGKREYSASSPAGSVAVSQQAPEGPGKSGNICSVRAPCPCCWRLPRNPGLGLDLQI